MTGSFRSLLICAGIFAFLSGCELFEKQRQPIGYSQDENGRPCTTYEIDKKDAVYETRCDYNAMGSTSLRNPLSRQEPYNTK